MFSVIQVVLFLSSLVLHIVDGSGGAGNSVHAGTLLIIMNRYYWGRADLLGVSKHRPPRGILATPSQPFLPAAEPRACFSLTVLTSRHSAPPCLFAYSTVLKAMS